MGEAVYIPLLTQSDLMCELVQQRLEVSVCLTWTDLSRRSPGGPPVCMTHPPLPSTMITDLYYTHL